MHCLVVSFCFCFKQDTFTQRLKQNCQETTKTLLKSIKSLSHPDLSVKKLYGLAHARVGLSVVAGHLANIVSQNIAPQAIPLDIWNVIDAAKKLCGQEQCRLMK